MIRFHVVALSGLLLVTGLAAVAPAQTGFRAKDELGEARFTIEAVDFRADQAGLHSLEIYYKLFYTGVSFQKTAQGYKADYEVAVAVEANSGEQIEGVVREGNIEVATYAETIRPTDFVINLITIMLEEQDVIVRVVLTDKQAGTTREVKKQLKKREYWNKYPSLSRVEFSRELSATLKESKFNKGDMRVIPSVSRVFGQDDDSLVNFYQEIYPGETETKPAKVITRIYHPTRGYVHIDTIDYGAISEVKQEFRSINIADLAPGEYELEIRLEGRRGRLLDKLVESIEKELTAESVYRNDYETAVEMVKYLTTKEERTKLKAAKTPEERRQVWDAFWKARTIEGAKGDNPSKEEYFRRVRHANRYFSFMKKEGWKTSRGMVYITYGEPDEVEDYPFELGSKPYQVWLYYRLSPPRRFMFTDDWGDGDYELQPPYNGIDW
jgi:GWxTD domain-containing protein